jgi:hypothetical protein
MNAANGTRIGSRMRSYHLLMAAVRFLHVDETLQRLLRLSCCLLRDTLTSGRCSLVIWTTGGRELESRETIYVI